MNRDLSRKQWEDGLALTLLRAPATRYELPPGFSPEAVRTEPARSIIRGVLALASDGKVNDATPLDRPAVTDASGLSARDLAEFESGAEATGAVNPRGAGEAILTAERQSRDLARLRGAMGRIESGEDSRKVLNALFEEGLGDDDEGAPDWRTFAELAHDFGRKFVEAKDRPAIETALPTGHRFLDRALNLTWGSFLVIGARAKTGKTTLALNIIRHAAKEHRIQSLIHSWEMPGVETFAKVVAETSVFGDGKGGEKGVSVFDMLSPGRLDSDSEALLGIAYKRTGELPILVNTQHRRLGDVLRISRRAIRHEGVKVIAVDYMQLADVEMRRGDTEQQAVSRISRGLRNLALDETEAGFPCLVIGISQLSRPKKGAEHVPPTMSDLRQSGQIEQDATHIVLLHDLDIVPPGQVPAPGREGHVAAFIFQRSGARKVALLEKQLEYSRFRSAREDHHA